MSAAMLKRIEAIRSRIKKTKPQLLCKIMVAPLPGSNDEEHRAFNAAVTKAVEDGFFAITIRAAECNIQRI